MSNLTIEKFHVIGISIRTTNENGQAMQDIPNLWNRCMSENIAQKIDNKLNDSIYCIYTDYEKDFTKPYTTIIGYKVANIENIPEGMIGKTIETTSYKKFIAQGNLLQGAVIKEWTKIWSLDLQRAYMHDFEVYGEYAKNPENAEVEIFISVK